MSGLMTEPANLQKGLFEERKESESRGAKLASLEELVDEVPAIKNEVSKRLSSAMKVLEQILAMDVLTHQWEDDTELMKEREKG